jgi:prephenate dehydrogenase
MEVLIIGLGQIGASISLALKNAESEMARTGYDPNPQISRAARKRGDIERIVFTPKRAARAADLIFLNLLPDETLQFLEMIGPQTKSGCVVIDTSPLKSDSIKFAQDYLREGNHYIGAVPVLNPTYLFTYGPDAALPQADLFQGGLLALTIPPKSPEKVVNLVHAIALILGADPFYIDPSELDAITAVTENLSAILGLALVQISLKAPTWREIQRLAGRTWAITAELGNTQSARELTETFRLNKTHIDHRLQAMVDELQSIQAMLREDNFEALSDMFQESSSAYTSWLSDRLEGKQSGFELHLPPTPRSSLMDRLFGVRRKKDG